MTSGSNNKVHRQDGYLLIKFHDSVGVLSHHGNHRAQLYQPPAYCHHLNIPVDGTNTKTKNKPWRFVALGESPRNTLCSNHTTPSTMEPGELKLQTKNNLLHNKKDNITRWPPEYASYLKKRVNCVWQSCCCYFCHFVNFCFGSKLLICSLFQLKKDQSKHVVWISNMFNLVSLEKVIEYSKVCQLLKLNVLQTMADARLFFFFFFTFWLIV